MNAKTEPIQEFEVNSSRTIMEADFDAPTSRGEVYEINADSIKKPAGLLSAAEGCQPLLWKLHGEYESCRDAIEDQLGAAAGLTTRKRKQLEKCLAAMAADPVSGLSSWIESMGPRDFAALKRAVIKWLEGYPDYDVEEDYAATPVDGQSAALQYFRSLKVKTLDLLGIEIIEGDHPGSTYFAAELHKDIDEANRIAEDQGIPVRFRRGNE